jgi:hypothetical protein
VYERAIGFRLPSEQERGPPKRASRHSYFFV